VSVDEEYASASLQPGKRRPLALSNRQKVTDNSSQQRLDGQIKIGANALHQPFDPKLAVVAGLDLNNSVGKKLKKSPGASLSSFV
jgi:hypothetical protein